MNISLFEYMLDELDRKVSADIEAQYRITTQRMHRLTAANDPKAVSGAQVFDDDDLLFDNVPL